MRTGRVFVTEDFELKSLACAETVNGAGVDRNTVQYIIYP